MKRVTVIGGGPAGMMAAISAAQAGAQVTLLEKNEKLGKKLYITGKGRCNLTNRCDSADFFDNIVTNRKFMYSAFYSFTNEDTWNFFEEHGLKLKEERGKRVFPESDHSSDVIRTLERALKQAGVSVQLKTEVKSLDELNTDAVVIATGGLSYASTGSTGDGYRFAESLGHTVTECRPALCPIRLKESYIRELEGLSLRNIEVRITRESGKELYSDFGEMLFTSHGVSGPVILSASSVIGKWLDKGEQLILTLDLKPALDEKQLDARVLRDFAKVQNRNFKNSLGKLLPAKLIPQIIRLSGIDEYKKVNEVTKEERTRLVRLLKCMEFEIEGSEGFNQAVITQGGVSVKDIDPSTMRSKLADNVYFAGEVLDVDAFTGGFNIQIALSTGWLAGQSAAIDDKKEHNMKQIAIDGPAGAGKSTAAKEVAKKMNLMYVDTGAMYRVIGMACLERGIDVNDETSVSECCRNADIDIRYIDGVQHMYLEGRDVSTDIRREEVGKAASDVSRFQAVRERLVAMQQDLGNRYDVIMDGRDIGTKVLTGADLKIYLTASVDCRAQRRFDELTAKGEKCDYEEIKKDIEQRDYNDMHRAISPLCKADDAIELDTSDMNIEEVTEAIISLYDRRS